MTVEKIKEMLAEYRSLAARVEEMRARRAEWENVGGGDGMRGMIEACIGELQKQAEATQKMIAAAGLTHTERRIIELHYVKGVRYEDIAVMMGYEVRTIYRIRRRAIGKMARVPE